MFANLITALLLALGVATGKVSSNVYKGGNAFNNEINLKETKPQPKKANYSFNIDLGADKKSEYTETVGTDTRRIEYARYELKFSSGANSTNPLVCPSMLIYNSIYTFSKPHSGGTLWQQSLYAIYYITNIYNSVNTFTVNTYFVGDTSANRTTYYGYYNYISTDESLDQIIGLTMTANTINYVQNTIETAEKEELDRYQTSGNVSGFLTVQNTSSEITLQPDETIYLIMVDYQTYTILNNNDPDGYVTPTGLNVRGSYIAPEVNQEIVDIPGLMFTIITLPFSFYSTAFNLTIFKGTPYALNFGNLILTIIAALMLFYLIKKVIR